MFTPRNLFVSQNLSGIVRVSMEIFKKIVKTILAPLFDFKGSDF